MAQSGLDLSVAADPAWWQDQTQALWLVLEEQVFSLDTLLQSGVILALVGIAYILKRPVTALIASVFRLQPLQRFQAGAVRFVAPIAMPTMAWLFLSAALFAMEQTDVGIYLVRTAANLLGAWAAIRMLSAFIAEPFWSRAVAVTAWSLAALNILGWLDPTISFLDSAGIPFGDDRISLLVLIRAAIVLAVFYWISSALSRLLSTRVQQLPSLNPSARILLTKAAQIVIMTTAGVMALSALNIDLSALAIFGGAVGLGIGFGLQKIFSNLVSGVLLLLDRSIKPGDVITVDDTYGRVSTLGMRFASVITRDGHEHLIPNEEFITTKVINWSYTDSSVRIKRMIGVSYDSDIRLAQSLIVEAAESVNRVIKSKTRCHLRDFGDNSVNLEVRFWIRDPHLGVNNVTSEVLFAVWDLFGENGISFPYPQRDVHLVGSDPIKVQVESGHS